MKAEILAVGTELILGDVVDTNSAYIAKKLTEYGVNIFYQSTVGDNYGRIVSSIKQALSRSNLVIITGGLGPTDDDLTREAIAEATGKDLKESEYLKEVLELKFKKMNRNMSSNNLKQALLPVGAEYIPNETGTAPGILLKIEGKTIISLPGVPREMKHIFENEVKSILLCMSPYKIRSRVLNFFSIGESSLEMEIKDILDSQTNPTIALLAGKGEVKIRITARGTSEKELSELIEKGEGEIRKRVGKFIYGTDDKGLPAVVGEFLKKKEYTLAVAESCTGGLIGNRITDIPGSSEYFSGGIISYSNQVKMDKLGVKRETLSEYGAVSRSTAWEMAVGVKNSLQTDIGLSVTGIAGPDGGSKEKPVGLVYLGLAVPGKVYDFKLSLNGTRAWNKWMASQYGLYYLLQYLKKNIRGLK